MVSAETSGEGDYLESHFLGVYREEKNAAYMCGVTEEVQG